MANPAHVGPFLKPSQLARETDKYERQLTREKAKRTKQAREARALQPVREDVWKRDRGVSRYSGTPVLRWTATTNPALRGHVHHIVYRSALGPTTTPNLVLLTAEEHEMVHGRHPKLGLDIYGNADETLRFVRRAVETGQMVDEPTISPNPSAGEDRP